MSDETQVTPEQTTEAETSVVDNAVEEPKVHPAYEKLLEEIPTAWHNKIIPHLQEQDKYFQKQLEQYTPFKEFVDDGISADLIRGGLNLANAVNTNPTEVYESLKDYLKTQGLLSEEAAQAAKDIMESESGEDIEDIFDGEKVPAALKKELDALKAETEEVKNWRDQQELAKATEEYTVELESEMAALKQAHNITEAHEVAIYDLMNAALNAGREITVADAAKQLQQMVGAFPPAGQEAPPTIVGSSGGAGIPAPDRSIPKDDAGKKAMMAAMFEEYRKANQ